MCILFLLSLLQSSKRTKVGLKLNRLNLHSVDSGRGSKRTKVGLKPDHFPVVFHQSDQSSKRTKVGLKLLSR